jgi:signal transduction histidine kinase
VTGALLTSWQKAAVGRLARRGLTIPGMASSAAGAQPVDFPARWARWVSLGGFAVLLGIALPPLRPNPAVAVAAAGVAMAASVLFVWLRRPLLLYAALATAGVTVLSYAKSSNVCWFTMCLLAVWCGLAGKRRDAVLFLGGTIALFIVEWVWIAPDPGWAAWIGGVILSTMLGLLVRQQAELVTRLREAQAGLAEQARTEERNRIGRELHDVIAHTLTVALLHVTSARLAVEHDPGDAARSLAEAERLSRESLEEVRLAVGMLHSRGDGDRTAPLPGVDGLPALVERFRTAGADITLVVDGDLSRLHAATGLTVYRIAQEALTNAVKHAADAPTTMKLAVGSGSVRLTVDSAGEPGTGSGLGMISMRERAESVGGSCQAGPGGRGWVVDASLPLAVGRRTEGAA